MSYKLAMNEYSDLEPAEFNSKMNGFKAPSHPNVRVVGQSDASSSAATARLPVSVDWRTSGYVTPVKNQGSCGSCWSFSATGAMEGTHAKRTGVLLNLSEQDLIDCSSRTKITVELRHKLVTHTEGNNKSGYEEVVYGNEISLKYAVVQFGPISAAIDARYLQYYSSGIFNDTACSSSSLNHAVLVVGYGQDSSGNLYRTVKNSWGTSWGENGYLRLARYAGNMCGIATMASYPTYD
ncbi:cathepsin L [Folsomia candida]|uniref:cathepsin L n=1 Tax=Folsomia candida TaxID=158441 RepID=UPI001604E01D|nr:cathepsin L [Folsomia candida]